jgi:hypothetical protein
MIKLVAKAFDTNFDAEGAIKNAQENRVSLTGSRTLQNIIKLPLNSGMCQTISI